MEPQPASRPRPITFVHRRWDSARKQYVDTEGVPIMYTAPAPPKPWETTVRSDPAIPPANGSAPFLSLPAELRLQIYGYLTGPKDDYGERVYIGTATRADQKTPPASTAYSYLYRSPGRMTRPNMLTPETVKIFHINRQTREEIIDSCFGDRTFVIEASLYGREAGGLSVMPARLGMTAWVKKLLLITVLDQEKGQSKGTADLRPLQEMTNLRELRIIFKADHPVDPAQLAGGPIRAAIECVPRTTKIYFGTDKVLQKELESELGSSISYVFRDTANAMAAYEHLVADLHNAISKRESSNGGSINRRDVTLVSQAPGLAIRQTSEGSREAEARALGAMNEKITHRCQCSMLMRDGACRHRGCMWRMTPSVEPDVVIQ